MFDSLKFCQGSVAKKDFVPELKHFVISNGRVRGFNGILALSSPIPFDIDCRPKADELVKAIGNCSETVTLTMTPKGRLSIKSGAFKAFIDCIQEETVHVEPEGDLIEIDGNELLKGLRAVVPFIGDDASRPWTNGVLIKSQSMFATNNAIVVEYWHGTLFSSTINLPRDAVREMLRIGEAPLRAQVASNSITFHYADHKWLRTQLYISEWPNMSAVLDQPASLAPIDDTLFDALEKIKSFTDKLGSIFFRDGSVCTHEFEDEGASHQIQGLSDNYFKLDNLMRLRGVVKQIDWSGTGARGACMFQGDRLRGAIIGMRKI